jgi:hypothetical protein
MVLRRNTLPEPFEDANPKICQGKRTLLAEQSQQHADPEHVTSLLLDMPVAKALNPYVRADKAWLVSGDGAVQTPRPDDQFRFNFLRLESRHVQMMNAIMLDQAYHSSRIVFNSRTALRTALEFYLDYPTQAKGMHSLKTITDRQDDPMLLLFQKLEHTACLLGSHVKARYHVDPLSADAQKRPLNRESDVQRKSADMQEQDPSRTRPNSKAAKPISGFSRQGLKKAFETLGSGDNCNGQLTGLVVSSPTAPDVEFEEPVDDFDQAAFDTIVTQVLKIAKPLVSNHPIDLAMVVMMEVLTRMQLQVRAVYALDKIIEVDGRPSYPELVFNSLHSVERMDLNHDTTLLLDLELHM